jgi:sphingomyelin phosphodiesterase 4
MLTELWFGNIPAPKTNYILRAATSDDLSVSNAQPYSANIDQMTAVRIVIKHLHSFSNSFTYSQISHINNQGLAEIKQAIWTVKYPLQKRLYNFIKVAFNRWPLDYTFRQPLEAWLSYIQPWRYVKIGNNEYNSDLEDLDGNSRSNTLIDVPSVDNHWKNFISDNLLYYTVIFSLLIDRLINLDLSSSRNSLMLFRVIKVYSQPGFLVLLKEAEDGVVRNNLDQTHNLSVAKSPHVMSTPNKSASDLNTSKARLLAPSFLASNGRTSTPKAKVGNLEHRVPSLESDSAFNYVSLFSSQSKQKLQQLLVEAQKSRSSIKDFILQVEHRSISRNRSWFDSIRAVLTMEDTCFESKDEREMYKDKIQAEEYLNFAINKITQYFDVQMPDIDMHEQGASNLTTSQRIFFNV